ncbi:FAD-dependent oxidoreductase [Agrococcus sp. Ld7]|uniref:FAD-dependent oxidoreductase n=1 Tax=Agrococcus sp. Ld7 TaxID=649148 RepID=UPI00386E3777
MHASSPSSHESRHDPVSLGGDRASHAAHGADDLAHHLDLGAAVARPATEAALDAAAAALGSEPARIIDLGAGTGAGSVALARRFPNARVDGIDIAPDLLDRLGSAAAAAGVAERVTAHRADLDGDWSSLIPAPVDLIWASLSLHHVDDAQAVLRQAFAALRPGGVIVVTEMNGTLALEPQHLGSSVAGLGGRIVAELEAAGYPPKAEWSHALAAAGFASVRREEHTLAAAGDTVEGACYLQHQLESWRHRIADGLSPAETSGLERAIADLEADDSTIVLSSGRATWVAVRPAEAAAPATEPHRSTAANADDSAQGRRATVAAEVVVIGGGAAGLAAAIALARSRRRVVLIDAGEPRNAPAHAAHNVLGNEGIAPRELLARGRAEARGYGVEILRGEATAARGAIDDFTIDVDGGTSRVHARRVILATGLIDALPDIPGIREAWGTSVLHCPFCHGWEVRDQRIGILTRDEIAIHHAMLFRQLSDDVTLFLQGAAEPTPEQSEQLAALHVRVVRSPVVSLVLDGRRLQAAALDDGQRYGLDALVVAPRFEVRTELFESLGGAAVPTPWGRQVAADARGTTAVPGVFAAGNASEQMAMVAAAMASGVATGSGVHGSLASADLEAEVQARRTISDPRGPSVPPLS